HMGIAENRQTIGTHGRGRGRRLYAGADGLVRQSVDQVEIDATDPVFTQASDGFEGLLFALDAVDGLLHHGIVALHAEAGTADAGTAQRGGHFTRQRTRVDL